jgi:hypothetical protein
MRVALRSLAVWATSVGANRHAASCCFREGTLPVPADSLSAIACADGRASTVTRPLA